MSRYDPEKNESKHAAAHPDNCLKMQKNNPGWRLKGWVKTDQPMLEIDCIFEGDTDFPLPYHETETED